VTPQESTYSTSKGALKGINRSTGIGVLTGECINVKQEIKEIVIIPIQPNTKLLLNTSFSIVANKH
jgi:hypothetical protein